MSTTILENSQKPHLAGASVLVHDHDISANLAGCEKTTYQGNLFTLRDEINLAKPYMPAVAWPSVIMAITLPIIQGALIWFAATGQVSYWIATPMLGYISFAWYTLIHESIHASIIRNRKYSFVHTIIGWVGSLNLFYTWPLLRRTHQRHHSHTNTHKDPDHELIAGSIYKLLRNIGLAALTYMVPYFLLRKSEEELYRSSEILNQRELCEHTIVMHLLQAFVLMMVVAGFGVQVLMLYVLPSLIGGFLLMVFFQWLPHHPFTENDRYKNARIMELKLGNVQLADTLLLNQNIHLIHHMWPTVPFHLYRKIFEANRDYLASKGARVEGLRPRRL